MIKLSPRLSLAAVLAGSGGSVIDVGTDHGYLPVYFARNDLFRRVAASELNEGPLECARESARRYGVSDRIEFYLSDGLKNVPGTFDAVVIAGMGGETMAGILSACPWVKSARLILQPQSKIDALSEYLDDAGFICRRAGLARDAGHLYAVFEAAAGEGGFNLARALLDARDGLLPECVERELGRVNRAVSGMESAAVPAAGELEKLKARRAGLEKLLKETTKWQD